MRKLFLIIILSTFCFTYAFSQNIDKTVATVKLTKTEAITQKQFQKIVTDYEKKLGRELVIDERKQILNTMIDEKLILQAAIRDNVTVSTAEINQGLQQAKQLIEMQIGKRITDDQFKKLIEAQQSQIGYTWDKLMSEVENSVLVQKYVQQKQGAQLKDVKKPSEDEVASYYEENRSNFVSPEMAKVKQIVVVTQGKSADVVDKYKKKIDEIYDKIVNKGGSMDDYFEVFIEGQPDRIGSLDIGVWLRENDDKKRKELYGTEFFNNVFKMKTGAISQVLRSNIGYHIVYVIEKIPFKTLALNDKIPPNNTDSVKDKIAAALQQNAMMQLSQKLQQDLVNELKKTAAIKITEQYLTW